MLNRGAVALVNLLKLDNSRLASSIKHRRVRTFYFSAIIVSDFISVSTETFKGCFWGFQVFPVQHGDPDPSYDDVRPAGPLAGLHLVRYRKGGATRLPERPRCSQIMAW